MTKNTASFVLIHGAWHGGWCWYKLAHELQQRGHQVMHPDLPGHGADTTPTKDVTMAAYIDTTVKALKQAPKSILVGHSMGGMVISGAAEQAPELINKLVYLCAFVPASGDSLNTLGRHNIATALQPTIMQPSEDGTAVIVLEKARGNAFYHDCSEQDVATANAQLVPQATKVMGETLTLSATAFGSVTKAYVECIEDQAIHIATQRKMIRDNGISEVKTLETSHSPFLSAPTALADALEALI